MKNTLLFAAILFLLGLAIVIGNTRIGPAPAQKDVPHIQPRTTTVPHIGSIQVLNGCGIDGAAGAIAEFLRKKGFDVKDVANATSWIDGTPRWNYPHTIVVSTTPDMANARAVAAALGTENTLLLRTEENHYDVIVYLGKDLGVALK
jgi:hypothetical protein